MAVIEARADCSGQALIRLNKIADITGFKELEINQIVRDLVDDGRLVINHYVDNVAIVTLIRSWC